VYSCFFFFQAEDGIRDRNVTGVQTCALPICPFCLLLAGAALCCRSSCSRYPFSCARTEGRSWVVSVLVSLLEILELPLIPAKSRSEERRVGKECRERWSVSA